MASWIVRPLGGWMALTLLAIFLGEAAHAAEPARSGPAFPRIGNCYGAGLGYKKWDEGRDYWSKLRLIAGGCLDLHYDWDSRDWSKALARTEENLAQLRKINPDVIVLPYVDVIEGIDNTQIPQAWWDLNAEGNRWSGWPGYFRINTKLPEVLQYNLDKVRETILSRPCFDGVFYDCWHTDPWLVPKTGQLRDGGAVVMINDWNLPRQGFATLNGCLAEDEYNRVIEGLVDFDDFLGRYLRWCRESRKPAVTMLVGHPRGMHMDPFRWHKLAWAERVKTRAALKDSDPQALRFGLCTTLMGDGYFGYDCANIGRGDWWWFPEFDAPLGHPKGPAQRAADGTWQRSFDGGLVVVNGSLYDAAVKLDGNYRDVSSGRVAGHFTLPMFDGRILLSSRDPPSGGSDPAPRVTAQPPNTIRAAALDEGLWAVQTPAGLDLRLGNAGQLRNILWRGKVLCTGGWPAATASGATQSAFEAEKSPPPEVKTQSGQAELTFRGTLVGNEQKVDYMETVAVRDDSFRLKFQFTAQTDLKIRLWRHYFAFPVAKYAGATAGNERAHITLPAALGNDNTLLPGSTKTTIESGGLVMEIDSSQSLGLVDHRKYHRDEYLLAGYPVRGDVKAGTQWSVETRLTIGSRGKP